MMTPWNGNPVSITDTLWWESIDRELSKEQLNWSSFRYVSFLHLLCLDVIFKHMYLYDDGSDDPHGRLNDWCQKRPGPAIAIFLFNHLVQTWLTAQIKLFTQDLGTISQKVYDTSAESNRTTRLTHLSINLLKSYSERNHFITVRRVWPFFIFLYWQKHKIVLGNWYRVIRGFWTSTFSIEIVTGNPHDNTRPTHVYFCPLTNRFRLIKSFILQSIIWQVHVLSTPYESRKLGSRPLHPSSCGRVHMYTQGPRTRDTGY